MNSLTLFAGMTFFTMSNIGDSASSPIGSKSFTTS
jgi:hypothetical protein